MSHHAACMSTMAVLLLLTPCAVSKIVPFHRYYAASPNGDHFYTTNAREIGVVTPGMSGAGGYKYERVAGFLSDRQIDGTIPLYRYWGQGQNDHFYTTHANEIGTTTRGQTGKFGYRSEGIAGFCWRHRVAGTIPLYRYFGNEHFYTTSASEIGTTTPGTKGVGGYAFEGVACYVKSKQNACNAKNVGGQWQWVPMFTIPTATEQSFTWGSSKSHETSRTREWSSSMTVAMSAGFSFAGFSSSIEVSNTIGKRVAQQTSDSWTTNKEQSIKFIWGEEDIGKQLWQFAFDAVDGCEQVEHIKTKEFTTTPGAWFQPCCLPGYFVDINTCHSSESKVSANAACTVFQGDGEDLMAFNVQWDIAENHTQFLYP